MNPVHWLRSRQEERELTYWLSIAAFDRHDHSLNNQIYLLYLVLFFGIWIFITLTFFASGMANLLRAFHPADPGRAAALLEMILLSGWSVYTLWQAVRRSPVVFSHEDASLICQMPVSRRQVALRWLPMPWIKSALPFWLAAVLLGFGLADTALSGQMGAGRIPEYASYGLRAWLSILPVHLALFLLNWVVGVYRLRKHPVTHRLPLAIFPAAMALVDLSFISLWFSPSSLSASDASWLNILSLPVTAGFGSGSLAMGTLASSAAAGFFLAMLARMSGSFSLSRAAQETRELEFIGSAIQYGFSSYAQTLRSQRRLGIQRKSSRMPAWPGAAALLWKDLIQSKRSVQFSAIWDWLVIFISMLSFAILPDLSSRALAAGIWIIQVGKVSAIRIRSDLERWPLARQLPISSPRFIMFDLLLAYIFTVTISLAGLGLSASILKIPVNSLAGLIPGITASIAGMTAFDVFRRSRSPLLLGGNVPEVGAGGVISGLVFAAIPMLINQLLPGIVGRLGSIAISLLLGWAAFSVAQRYWRRIPRL